MRGAEKVDVRQLQADTAEIERDARAAADRIELHHPLP
jgi:hypothetical protein